MVETTCVFGIKSFRCSICKACKSVVKKWFRRKKRLPSSNEDNRPHNHNKTKKKTYEEDENKMKEIPCFRSSDDCFRRDNGPTSSSSSRRGLHRHGTRSFDSSSCFSSIPSSFSGNEISGKNLNRRKSRSSYEYIPTPASSWNGSRSFKMPAHHTRSISGSSRRSSTIMFSNSSGMLKPLPIEKTLECTLEELCYGCTKKISISRDVITDNGEIVPEEEVLVINVQPGWKTGTKITFEGKGSDRPGKYREDVIFFISEKRHLLFRREGDDLELGIEVPLLKALIGCTISVPLLGGEKMNLTVDDIIYPGYEKVIAGQGMPISKEPGKRGNLRITFLVEFPLELTESQRSEVVNILQNCF